VEVVALAAGVAKAERQFAFCIRDRHLHYTLKVVADERDEAVA
jgi:hypothetical protein